MQVSTINFSDSAHSGHRFFVSSFHQQPSRWLWQQPEIKFETSIFITVHRSRHFRGKIYPSFGPKTFSEMDVLFKGINRSTYPILFTRRIHIFLQLFAPPQDNWGLFISVFSELHQLVPFSVIHTKQVHR